MADMDLNKFKHPTTGLVPVRIKVDEAGAGLVPDEVRGVSMDVAKKMIAAGHAEPVMPTVRASKRAKPSRPAQKTVGGQSAGGEQKTA